MLFPEVWLEKEQEVGQSYTTDADCKSTCYPVLLTSGYKLEVSPTASLGSINLLERLRALKTHLFTGFLVYYKRIQVGTAKWKRYIGVGRGKGLGTSMPSRQTLWELPHVHQTGSSPDSVCPFQF